MIRKEICESPTRQTGDKGENTMVEESNVSGEQIQEAAAPAEVESREAPLEQAVGQSTPQEQMVPLSALQSERAQRQQMQEKLQMIEEHLALQSRPKETPKDEFEGLDDNDVMTIGEFKKLSSKMANNFQITIDEMKMMQKYSDYQEVITKYLPEVIKQNPGLRKTLQTTQDYELAYYLAKNSDPYRTENKKVKKSMDAQRIVENSQRAGSLSSMGSTSPISQAKRYRDMSEKEFREVVNRNLGEY